MVQKNFIKWGILGCGSIANAFAEGLKKVPNAKLEAVASKSRKAEPFGKKFNIKKRYNNYKDLVSDSDIDIVYIATTHNFHYENILLCLEHGKAVLSEKPFTINAFQAKVLINKAKKEKIFLMEGMWTRFIPCVVKLRELIDKNRILGEIRHFKGDFCVNMPYGNEHRVYNPKLAGGALLDLGVYSISFTSMIFKEPPEKIMSSAILGETGVDVFSSYLFSYKSGSTSMMNSSTKILMPHDAYIVGTKGYMHVPNFSRPTNIFLHLNNEKEQTIEIPYEPTGFQFEAIEVGNCLRKGKIESEIMPLRETLEIMNSMDTLRTQWGFKYPEEN